MQIRHIAISRFRGIRSLDWHVDGRLLCLVGPGDSTKTTILDAIEFALAPRWYVPFSDADFYNADTKEPFSILLTIGELPEELMVDDKCGLYLRGYRSGEKINDDPEDGWEAVITVRLQVTSDLEPQWELVKESNPEVKSLSWRDRERLGVARLGDEIERHLTWSRGSALSRITGTNTYAGPTLAQAHRAANAAIAGASLAELEAAATKAQEAALAFGVDTLPLRPGLDTQSLSFGTGALSLHDERQVPIRATGLGTRRLMGLAIQQASLGPDAIVLIDEIEHGLEPHRIRRLLRKLRDDHLPPDVGETQDSGQGQVIMTSHSPTAIMALPVEQLRFVKSANGVTTVEQVTSSVRDTVQSIVRKIGHAVLARKIIVCEGKTEEALCRILDDYWAERHDGKNLACFGVVPVLGGGNTEGPKAAQEFARLGYQVAFLGDSDAPIQPSKATLEAQGIKVVLWAGSMSTEERIAVDLPWSSLQSLISVVIEERGDEPVLGAISANIGQNLVPLGPSLDDWLAASLNDTQIRRAIGKTAKSKGNEWFKDLNAGETLGQIVVAALPAIGDSELAKALTLIEDWAYAE